MQHFCCKYAIEMTKMFSFLKRTKRTKCYYKTSWNNTKCTLVNFLIGNGYDVRRQFRMWRQNGNNCFFPPCALSNPWISLFKVLLSTVAFFITFWDNYFFLLLLLFFYFSTFSSQEKFHSEIWLQNQYSFFCIKGESP